MLIVGNPEGMPMMLMISLSKQRMVMKYTITPWANP